MWMGLSKFGSKHPASGTFFPHTTALRTGDQQRPTKVLMELRKTVTLLHPTLDITATDPEWPMPISSVWLQHGPELASTLLQGSVGSPVTL